jgi:hypothetical protein
LLLPYGAAHIQLTNGDEGSSGASADTCHQYGPNCQWDGGATYNYKFSARQVSQVSVLDFFHPDLDGQAALARVSWAASWWPTT